MAPRRRAGRPRGTARAGALPVIVASLVACAGEDHRDATTPPGDAVVAADAAPDVLVCAPRRADPLDRACADPCFDRRGPLPMLQLDVAALGLATPPGGSRPVRVGIFLAVTPHTPEAPWTRAQVEALVRDLVTATDRILAQCALHVALEAAQVIALPARLLDIQGNAEGSFGGHPPPGTANPDLFNYLQNERLTEETRELFAYGRRYLSRNAIAAYTVRHIAYWAEQAPTAAGGLSFSPSIYHHADDYPLRNSVLLVPTYPSCGALPRRPRDITLAHELGHMLLDSGTHPDDRSNLMSGFGTRLTPAQCATMRANLTRLFGEAAVADPGAPTRSP